MKQDSQGLINQLQLIFKKDSPQTKEQMKGQALFIMIQGGIEAIHEVEIELIDPNYMASLLESDYIGFTKIVDRYLRNAEVLFSWPDEFSYTGYR